MREFFSIYNTVYNFTGTRMNLISFVPYPFASLHIQLFLLNPRLPCAGAFVVTACVVVTVVGGGVAVVDTPSGVAWHEDGLM